MWDTDGLYAVVRGARLTAPIQVETSSTRDAEPSANVWISGHDYIRTGGSNRLTKVPRADFAWDFAQPAPAPRVKEDRFFLSWTTLAMSAPTAGPRRVSFVINDDGLLEVPRGGAWLTWNDLPAPQP
jgi:hypothetical protein